MQDRELSPEGQEFQPGMRLVESLVDTPNLIDFPILHGLTLDGFFFFPTFI